MNDATLNSIRSKLAKFCAYRERATKEVKMKLDTLGANTSQSEIIINELKEEGYLDDTRFAKAFAGGKFRSKKWGKLKIKRELKFKDISEENIQIGLQEIEGQNYLEILEQLARQKFDSIKNKSLLIKKTKVASFLISKGYESDLVWGVLNKINED